jgi:hypothetical protein
MAGRRQHVYLGWPRFACRSEGVRIARPPGSNAEDEGGSDIHDLVRMMDGRHIDELATLFEAAPPELAALRGEPPRSLLSP